MTHNAAAAASAAITGSTPIVSVRPIVLPAPGRGEDLQVRATAPTTGSDLPIVVFSHGFGESMDGYAPLAEFWAAHGCAVLQPTHLDSQTLGIAPQDPRTPVIWRFRIEDLTRVLDQLDLIEASIPGLAGRLKHDRIAVAGHSWGATTASARLGARIVGRHGHVGEDLSDPRVLAGVLLAVAAMGGIAGYSTHETTDWSLERIALIQQVTTAYLCSALNLEDETWSQVRATLGTDTHPLGRLESK